MNPHLLTKIFGNLCPQCLSGAVFNGYLDMNEKCPECGFILQRGSGYFVMSWFINYILSGLIVMPIFLILIVMGFSFAVFMIVPLVILILMQPFMIRFSRLLWIHLDYQVEQSKKKI